MRSAYIEETLDLSPLEVDLDPDTDAVDPRYVAFVRVLEYTEATLDVCMAKAASGEATVDGQYAATLWEVYRTGVDLLQHEDYEAIRADFDALDDEWRRTLRSTVGYAAPHFGVEDFDVPAPEGESAADPEVVSDG